MKRIIALFLTISLLLCGCSFWLDGSYSSVEPHEEPSKQANDTAVTVYNYADVTTALSTWIEAGKESGMLSMQYESEEKARNDVDTAVAEVSRNNPFAAYGVDKIDYQFGTSSGRKAVSVQISYLQNRTQPGKIQRAANLQQAEQIIKQQLDACAAGVVVYFEGSEQPDYVQMVADYAMDYPQRVMESPEVTVSLYPEEGEKQIVELKFSYQTSRAELRTLQNKIAPVFASAALYVSGKWSPAEKAQRLYEFLMGRYEYNIQTSITPAYSLLLHGVGDQRAFAMVYGAMCREAGLNCYLVTGTRNGVPWVWNAVQLDGEYHYIDLLNSVDTGFRLSTQEEMKEYVWDYSAYPTAVKEN